MTPPRYNSYLMVQRSAEKGFSYRVLNYRVTTVSQTLLYFILTKILLSTLCQHLLNEENGQCDYDYNIPPPCGSKDRNPTVLYF